MTHEAPRGPEPTGAGTEPVTTPPARSAPANQPPPPPGTSPASEPVSDRGTSSKRQGDPLRGSRASGFWTAIVALGLVLVLLVIFIVQNTQAVDVQFLAFDVRAPLSASLLVAAAAGILLAAIGGTLRIWQLRRRVKRTR